MLNKSYYDNVFLVDSTGFVLKYWFSMPPVETKNYESIAAFLGFSSFVVRLLNEYNPSHISFAFDESLDYSNLSQKIQQIFLPHLFAAAFQQPVKPNPSRLRFPEVYHAGGILLLPELAYKSAAQA